MSFLCAFERIILLTKQGDAYRNSNRVYVQLDRDVARIYSSRNLSRKAELGCFSVKDSDILVDLLDLNPQARISGHIMDTKEDKRARAIFRVYGPKDDKRDIHQHLAKKGIAPKRVRYPRKPDDKNKMCISKLLAARMTDSQEEFQNMAKAWKDLAEIVPNLTEFFGPGRPLKDKDVVYFLNSATDYIYSLQSQVNYWKNMRAQNQEELEWEEEEKSDSDATLDYESE